MTGAGRLAIVVVNWNAGPLLLECLASLVPEAADREVVLVDNASSDGSTAAARERHPGLRLVETGANVGFAAGANRGAGRVAGDVLVFVNPDARVLRGALERLSGVLRAAPRAGVAGGGLRHPDGGWQPAWARFAPLSHLCLDTAIGRIGARRRRSPFEVDWVYGTFLAVRRALFERLGGFDERYFMYGEDMDLCWRAHALGARVLHVPDAVAVHGDSVSARRRYGLGREAAVVRGELRFYRAHRPADLAAYRWGMLGKHLVKGALATVCARSAAARTSLEVRRVCREWAP